MLDPEKLQRVAKGCDIYNPGQLKAALKKKAGVETSYSQAGRLWRGETDAKQSTIDSLCKALHCERGDILERVGRKRS